MEDLPVQSNKRRRISSKYRRINGKKRAETSNLINLSKINIFINMQKNSAVIKEVHSHFLPVLRLLATQILPYLNMREIVSSLGTVCKNTLEIIRSTPFIKKMDIFYGHGRWVCLKTDVGDISLECDVRQVFMSLQCTACVRLHWRDTLHSFN